MKEVWRRKALGDFGEAKTVQALETLFQSRPSFLLTGFKAEKILQLARESAKYSLGQSRKQNLQLFSVQQRRGCSLRPWVLTFVSWKVK